MKTCIAPMLCTLVLAVAPAATQVLETPNEIDIPQPVPISVDLAGSERPDIARFLNVRSR